MQKSQKFHRPHLLHGDARQEEKKVSQEVLWFNTLYIHSFIETRYSAFLLFDRVQAKDHLPPPPGHCLVKFYKEKPAVIASDKNWQCPSCRKVALKKGKGKKLHFLAMQTFSKIIRRFAAARHVSGGKSTRRAQRPCTLFHNRKCTHRPALTCSHIYKEATVHVAPLSPTRAKIRIDWPTSLTYSTPTTLNLKNTTTGNRSRRRRGAEAHSEKEASQPYSPQPLATEGLAGSATTSCDHFFQQTQPLLGLCERFLFLLVLFSLFFVVCSWCVVSRVWGEIRQAYTS